jgi:hypothetical protein
MSQNIQAVSETTALNVEEHFKYTLHQLFRNISATAKMIVNNYMSTKTTDIVDAAISGLLTAAINSNPLSYHMHMERCRLLEFNFCKIYILRLGIVNNFALEVSDEKYTKLQQFAPLSDNCSKTYQEIQQEREECVINVLKYLKHKYENMLTISILTNPEPLAL